MIKKYLLTVMLIFAVSAGAWAQGKDTTKAPDVAKALSLASQLVEYGYTNNSASSLIEAAKIIKENGIKEGKLSDAEGTEENNQTASSTHGIKNEKSYSLNADKLLADAKKLASGDKNLLAMADKASKTSTRGVNYRIETFRISAGSTYTWKLNRSAGNYCSFTVVGDEDTKVYVDLYDSNGNRLFHDWFRYGSSEYSWYCGRTQTYRLVLYNSGSVYTDCAASFE